MLLLFHQFLSPALFLPEPTILFYPPPFLSSSFFLSHGFPFLPLSISPASVSLSFYPLLYTSVPFLPISPALSHHFLNRLPLNVMTLYPFSLWRRFTHSVCGDALPIEFVSMLYPFSLWRCFTNPTQLKNCSLMHTVTVVIDTQAYYCYIDDFFFYFKVSRLFY